MKKIFKTFKTFFFFLNNFEKKNVLNNNTSIELGPQ